MRSEEPMILKLANHVSGKIGVGTTGVNLNWDLHHQLVWIDRAGDGEKIFTTDEEFGAFKKLRVAILHLAYALIDERPYPEDDLTLLNSWAGEINLMPRLSNEGLVYTCRDFADALTWIAIQAVYFLGSVKPGQVRKCEGCQTLFFDTSPTGRRKWCAMAKCGNRNKARIFNEKNAAIN